MKTPADFFTALFLKQLVSTPRGRGWLFSALANVEGDQELNVFAALAEAAPDLGIERMIRRHAADEERHAAQLEALAVREGVPRFLVPTEANALHNLDRALGVLSQPIRTAEDAMRAYVLLQVMEERACTQYPLYVEALRGVDDEAGGIL